MADRVIINGRFDRREWNAFTRHLNKLAPDTRKELFRQFKSLAGDMVSTAKREASWSSRIPGAIKPQITARRVGLRVASKRAPHARPYEGISSGATRAGTFRHPVFGDREVWVSQKTRPFLLPAVQQHSDEFVDKAVDAVDEAAKKAGW